MIRPYAACVPTFHRVVLPHYLLSIAGFRAGEVQPGRSITVRWRRNPPLFIARLFKTQAKIDLLTYRIARGRVAHCRYSGERRCTSARVRPLAAVQSGKLLALAVSSRSRCRCSKPKVAETAYPAIRLALVTGHVVPGPHNRDIVLRSTEPTVVLKAPAVRRPGGLGILIGDTVRAVRGTHQGESPISRESEECGSNDFGCSRSVSVARYLVPDFTFRFTPVT